MFYKFWELSKFTVIFFLHIYIIMLHVVIFMLIVDIIMSLDVICAKIILNIRGKTMLSYIVLKISKKNSWIIEFRTILIMVKIDWLIIYSFTSRSRSFHFYGDATIAGEGLQNLGLHVCSALRAFEQGGIFIVPYLLWHGTSVFPVSSEGPPQSVASNDRHGSAEDLHVF
jgi:hypothetical protein